MPFGHFLEAPREWMAGNTRKHFQNNRFTEVDGARLRRLRHEHALSQRDLSRMTGIAFDTISRLETGKQQAQPRTIRKLADTLGVEPRALMKED
jgi:predicted transcriptional regulator